ncbi:PadR family transcriptional regulator [Herbiconiux sp. KACC 21604]|uniref:PadR family transcriptional regulator n=1 Tax=unclassified Herbiconiux TaxID=2618217 RepID=UPI00149104BC|nr:PadR family transcriptional regulator [Herbiconiux sp. SALV-R1]QJU54703.1 PadR family transcriptional regulator [Herbiconiux sp. SALV-R1]WPO85807.1 PadR family transcriptional regulator [Herbiconiux sp. KACC 21604]
MATLTTRALLLGVASIFEPANGYQLRRELLSWGVEEWANIRPGSIYSMLATFTRQGLLERHDLHEGERDVAVYTVTDAGKAELQTLLREATVTVNAMDPSAFRVVLSLAPLIPRASMLEALRERERRWAASSETLLDRIAYVARGLAPPHVSHSLELELRLVETERAWLADYIGTVESGGLAFDGEEFGWAPPENDAGWQMVRESQSYREQLEG